MCRCPDMGAFFEGLGACWPRQFWQWASPSRRCALRELRLIQKDGLKRGLDSGVVRQRGDGFALEVFRLLRIVAGFRRGP